MRAVFLVRITILCVALLLLRTTFIPVFGDGLWRCLEQKEQSSCCHGVHTEPCSEDRFCDSPEDCLSLPMWTEAESKRSFDLLVFPPFFKPPAYFSLVVFGENKALNSYSPDLAYLILQVGWDHIRLLV
jgi:hypothetical protein